jgi:drug/metabolite transporter (DMT)-like permease
MEAAMTEQLTTGGELVAPSIALTRQRSLKQSIQADLALLLVTLVWGGTFVMVKDAIATYPVFGFIALRFGIASALLVPVVLWRRMRAAPRPHVHSSGGSRVAKVAPLLLGVALFAGYGFQTAGLALTTPAKAGFITGLSVVLVPMGSALLLRQAPSRAAWWGVGMATVGLALLSLNADLGVGFGDLLVMCCAVAFAVHILITARFAPGHDPLDLLFGQVLTVTLLSALVSLLFEQRPALTGQVLFAAAFTGLFATLMAFGIQMLAQRYTTATHTALIFAAEPVFAALFSFLLIGELLGPRQIVGCLLILGGMVVAEVLPLNRRAPVTALSSEQI